MIPALVAGLLLSGAPQVYQIQREPETRLPVLDFPEPGLDDTAAYRGYQTRFYRDSRHNTVQIYLDALSGRVVNLGANAANESAGFTVRDAQGRPVRMAWGAEAARVAGQDGEQGPSTARYTEYVLQTNAEQIELGWFVLGSMRIERDFQYAKRHLLPYTAPPFQVAEESLLVSALARLPSEERDRQLGLLRAGSTAALAARLLPFIAALPRTSADAELVRISRPSLDGRNILALEIRTDPRRATMQATRRTVAVRKQSAHPIQLTVRVITDAAPLTPLERKEIFNPGFLGFLTRAGAVRDSAGKIRHRRLERQVRAVELLSSGEKLMAGLPNFATYFGRDMMMSALMMRPIWTPGMSERVIAVVLRKLGPGGNVSHEEALGGQAIRENAVVYDSIINAYLRATEAGRRAQADSMLSAAREILRGLQKTRENYHMIDDEFQLPVLAAGYLADSSLLAARKRTFLLDSTDGRGPRLRLLLQEMALVATWTRPYIDNPVPARLVSFPKRDATHWRAASWRDSDAGYAGGRFALDVNAIWAPHALESIASILPSLQEIGFDTRSLYSLAPEIRGTALGEYIDTPASLRRAIQIWQGARSHFEITLDRKEIRRRISAKLAWLPDSEQRYWQEVLADRGEVQNSLSFLALALDQNGAPIPVVNTDPATELFLGGSTNLEPFLRPYPVGMFVAGLGPVVANDAYATREIWESFRKDTYHGPRVVWGREVNLLLLGLAKHISRGSNGALKTALSRTLDAVNASGLEHNELWSYQIEGSRLIPVRYGTSSDVQLWNTTDLAVEYVLATLPH